MLVKILNKNQVTSIWSVPKYCWLDIDFAFAKRFEASVELLDEVAGMEYLLCRFKSSVLILSLDVLPMVSSLNLSSTTTQSEVLNPLSKIRQSLNSNHLIINISYHNYLSSHILLKYHRRRCSQSVHCHYLTWRIQIDCPCRRKSPDPCHKHY